MRNYIEENYTKRLNEVLEKGDVRDYDREVRRIAADLQRDSTQGDLATYIAGGELEKKYLDVKNDPAKSKQYSVAQMESMRNYHGQAQIYGSNDEDGNLNA